MEANKEGRDLFERALMNGHFGIFSNVQNM